VDRLVVITGLSGSGKTLAANCLEDLGFFCVDNLPVDLIPPFWQLMRRSGSRLGQAAIVVDARESAFLERYPTSLAHLEDHGIPIELIFFECSDDVLKRRFSESRRPHPMSSTGGTLEEAIAAERVALGPLRERAERIVDTSAFTSHELRAFLKRNYGGEEAGGMPQVTVLSFGFKYGAPTEADLLFDVRFLPNPYFDENLRHLDGRNPEVAAYVSSHEKTGQFASRLEEFLTFLVPHYAEEGKTYLTVAIGCTGGKHRSVAMSERIGAFLQGQDIPAVVHHRDVGKE